MTVWERLPWPAGEGRAVRNARSASRELSRLRLEREAVQLYLEERGVAAGSPVASSAGRSAAPTADAAVRVRR